jgi:hypothetical protein
MRRKSTEYLNNALLSEMVGNIQAIRELNNRNAEIVSEIKVEAHRAKLNTQATINMGGPQQHG